MPVIAPGTSEPVPVNTLNGSNIETFSLSPSTDDREADATVTVNPYQSIPRVLTVLGFYTQTDWND